jgi:hypothetical protein
VDKYAAKSAVLPTLFQPHSQVEFSAANFFRSHTRFAFCEADIMLTTSLHNYRPSVFQKPLVFQAHFAITCASPFDFAQKKNIRRA